ncbi:S-adenosyl-L-methionine-dependent methyltransferase [Pseudovirgaria hyperparasitica]|uniref:S-adenosyl-L-methionine-dependent methyltransferase n=1 Tax=Pseudovirgaria hyperparasitica TaxID=470096 RepID=A0A6A6VTW0_9PEZI|nr:S-adenosyl-L-methionine-dependent methyltransferase [Pseudovirgaria hyperparasitica]KAF2753653.1 S-adenosyl-L-methionine-dependent methyltransferase [Pseudovirgaria hyperparasitica]
MGSLGTGLVSPATTPPRQVDTIDTLVDTIKSCFYFLRHDASLQNEQQKAVNESKGPSKTENGFRESLNARTRLVQACRLLINALEGPTETSKNMALVDKHSLVSLQTINHYRIAELVPANGDISIEALADKVKLPADTLARILRQAMTYQVFREPRNGYISHTVTSMEIPRLEPLLTYQLEVCLPSSLGLIRWLKQGQEDAIKSPFQVAHHTEDSWWEYAGKRPSLIQGYGRYMELITNGGPHDVSHVVRGFAWESLGEALVVDIGGANGFVSVMLADAFPSLTLMIQDSTNLQEVADATIPAHLKGRVTFTPHSFFEPQKSTSRGADIFLLRHILHDWADEDCITILRQLTQCLKPGASIIVAEQVMSMPGAVDRERERVMRALDMQMMVQFGGKERTLEDWEGLFQRADESLEMVGVVKPDGSADSLIQLKKSSE